MSDMIKIKVHIGTGFAGCTHDDVYEYPRESWEAMTEREREDLLDEFAIEFRNERIECSSWVIDE